MIAVAAGNGIKEEEVVKAIAVGRRAIDMMEDGSRRRGNINIIIIPVGGVEGRTKRRELTLT